MMSGRFSAAQLAPGRDAPCLTSKLRSAHKHACASRFTQRAVQQKQSESRQTSGTESVDAGAADGFGRASSDVLRLFSETQRNLLELNRSRLSALDELRAANSKISALESKLAENKLAENKLAETAVSSDVKPETDLQQPVEDSQQKTNGSVTPEEDVATSTITLVYNTGWSRVMMHYCADGKTWTELPGVQMESGSGNLAGHKVMQVKGDRLEFVLNDGSGQWDTPDPYGAGQTKNYHINTPGKYKLKDGKLTNFS